MSEPRIPHDYEFDSIKANVRGLTDYQPPQRRVQALVDEFNARYEGKQTTSQDVAVFLSSVVNRFLRIEEGAEGCLSILVHKTDPNKVAGIGVFHNE